MSKRAVKIVTMDDLISVVGKDAARYFFNSAQGKCTSEF
jgi:arginyl-tRNA synthetase